VRPAAAGAAVLALVGAGVGFAWVDDSPLVPTDGGRLVGDRSWAWAFLACLAAAFVAYLGGLWLLRRGGRFLLVAALAVAIQLAPLAAPPLLSSDVYTYRDYGRIAAVHGGNPYRDTPAEFPRDPAFARVGADWRDTSSVYGPAFTLASEALAPVWIYKALAAVFVLAAAFLAAARSRRPAYALAFVGWNPLLAIHFAGGGHNDAWLAALVLLAVWANGRGRVQLAGVAWCLSVLVKWIPLLLLPLRALQARATGRRVGHLGFAATAVVVLGVATWRYGLAWAGAPFGNAGRETSYAIPHRLEQLGLPHGAAIGLCAAAFVLAYAWLLREAWRGRDRLALAAGLLLLALPYLAVWYVAWTIPLAAAEDDRSAQLLGLALCAYLLRQTIPL
jgi:alpha-1,6-mannosyltransferase